VAALAAAGGSHALVPAELRLHADESGLPRFARGTGSRRWLLRRLRRHWWRYGAEWDGSQVRGVHRIAPARRYALAVARLAAAPPRRDRASICRRFVADLLDPLAPRPGAWIEKSPSNCSAAGFLAEMFPEMRLVHVVRDGRDVACSFMRVPWAPNDFEQALGLWERNLLEAHLGTVAAGPERVHRLALEDLVTNDRERSYRDLIGFLGITDQPFLRAFFERELTPERARIGRWRIDLPRFEHARAQQLYDAALERLAAVGVRPLPESAEVADLASAAPSPIDPWAVDTGTAF
jgi:hypothetical protein